jgi:hypothetical protein
MDFPSIDSLNVENDAGVARSDKQYISFRHKRHLAKSIRSLGGWFEPCIPFFLVDERNNSFFSERFEGGDL